MDPWVIVQLRGRSEVAQRRRVASTEAGSMSIETTSAPARCAASDVRPWPDPMSIRRSPLRSEPSQSVTYAVIRSMAVAGISSRYFCQFTE